MNAIPWTFSRKHPHRTTPQQVSISPMLNEQLLLAQIPTDNLTLFWYSLKSSRVKVASKTLVKSTPGWVSPSPQDGNKKIYLSVFLLPLAFSHSFVYRGWSCPCLTVSFTSFPYFFIPLLTCLVSRAHAFYLHTHTQHTQAHTHNTHTHTAPTFRLPSSFVYDRVELLARSRQRGGE